MGKEGKYIYCIIGTGHERNFGPIGIGGRGDEVSTTGYEDMGMVVSNHPETKLVVNRENMLAHEKVIEEVMKYHPVLPVRFGTIAGDEGHVKRILAREYDRFKQLLSDISDKKELGLKIVFREDTIYNDILTNYSEIRMRKERIAREPAERTYHERMEIGRLVEAAVEKEKERYRENIMGILTPLCDDIKINNPYGERMILNAAFLINKSKEVVFDLKVNELSDKYNGKMKFKYVGTLPPFNFVSISINTGDY
ncbi:MAG: GvpL/GvpF family gas vesicle protein [Nitrospirae bacterium]|nr:GvpL/GvpF family gas vesicle protein [Nitrospirota bacterium]